ncbi:MAG TPA: hypothetical protein VG537_09220, partial [Candidatus Kapabacteria bacterium]|nr:hypothetical protein [Candidatus Kapabacteria bacterium]
MNRVFRFFIVAVFLLCALHSSDAQWVQVHGKGGASVTSLSSGPMGLFAGTNSGVLRSTDDGITWNTLNAGLTDSNITAIFASGPNVLAGTFGGAMFRLNDSGTSWMLIDYPGSIHSFTTLGPYLYAAGGRTVTFSTDMGITWEINDTSFRNFYVRSLASLSTQLFAGTGNGIMTSLDFGVTWQASNALLGNQISALASLGNILLAGNSNEYDTVHPNGIYRSTDFGESWTIVHSDPLISVLSFCVTGSEIFAATDIGVLISLDSGYTWEIRNTGLTNLKVQTLTMVGTTLFAGTQGDGTFRSTDSGRIWKPGNIGIEGTFPTTLYHTNDGLFVITQTGGLLRSVDEGASWQSWNPSSTNLVQAFTKIDNRFFVAAENPPVASGNPSGFSSIYFSTDEGSSWTKENSADSQYYKISFSAFGSNIFATTQDDGVLLSSDSGLTWVRVDSGLGRW